MVVTMTDPEETSTDPAARWLACKEAGDMAALHERVLEAEEEYQDALQIAEQSGPGDPRLAETLCLLGRLYARSPLPSHRRAAVEPLQRALALREQAPHPEP